MHLLLLLLVLAADLTLPSSTLFDASGAGLTEAGQAQVDALAARMLAEPALGLLIEVHTDPTGSSAYNLKLSQDHADALVAAIIAEGVAPERLRGVGQGETNPISHAEREGLRRVELTWFTEGFPRAPVAPEPVHGVRLEGEQIVLPEKIHFEFDKGVIRPESFPTLDALADFLLAHPELARVEIAVHNDGRDTSMYSIVLTERRAHAIAEALIERGVARERLAPKGYEHTQPIAPHDTPEGRAMNRRVELWVREVLGAPSPIPQQESASPGPHAGPPGANP